MMMVCVALQSGIFTLFCCCVGEGAQTLLPDRVRWACEEWSVILNGWFEHPKAPYVSCGCGGCGGACGVSCGVVNQQSELLRLSTLRFPIDDE